MDYIDPILNIGMFGNPNNDVLMLEGTITEQAPPASPARASSSGAALSLVPKTAAGLPDAAAGGGFPWWLAVVAVGLFLLVSEQ